MGLRDGHGRCQEGIWVGHSPGSAPSELGRCRGHHSVSGGAEALTAALGAAGVVPSGRAGAGSWWALLALAVCLPRLWGRKRV